MLKINLGYWQLCCAKDVMVKAWSIVKNSKCNISSALKQSWKIIKKYISDISTSYKEYRYKLFINKQNYVLTFKDNNLDNIIEVCLEKIAKIEGKSFIYKISNNFYKKYNKLLNKFQKKGTLTFAKDIFVIKLK